MSDELAKKAYQAYGRTTEFKNYQGLPMPEWEELPAKIQEAWRNAATAVASSPENPRQPSPCRCYWVVEAGVIPGLPVSQYTKRFDVSSAEHESSEGEITAKRMDEALEYVRSLHVPEALNWVILSWVWA